MIDAHRSMIADEIDAPKHSTVSTDDHSLVSHPTRMSIDISWRGRTYLLDDTELEEIIPMITTRIHAEAIRFVQTLRRFQDHFGMIKDRVLASKDALAASRLETVAASLQMANSCVGRLIGLAYGTSRSNLLTAFRLMRPIAAGLNRAASEINAFAQFLGYTHMTCRRINVELSDTAARLIPRILSVSPRPMAAPKSAKLRKPCLISCLVEDATRQGQWVTGGVIDSDLTMIELLPA